MIGISLDIPTVAALGTQTGSAPAVQAPVQYIVAEYPILVFVNDPPTPRPATQSTLVV